MTKPGQFDLKIIKSSKIKEDYFDLLNTVEEYSLHQEAFDRLRIHSLGKPDYQKAKRKLNKYRELLEEEFPYNYNDIATNVSEIHKKVDMDDLTKSKLTSAFSIIYL
ncbi:MAG: hypothetical protein ACFE95_11375 [Candidatus Hodarchaeota archaeon]